MDITHRLNRFVSVVGLSLGLLAPATAHAYRARVTWAPVAGAAGYQLYVREGGGAYGNAIDVGARLPDDDGRVRFEVNGLAIQTPHEFAVTSYDATRIESARSNELSVTYADVAAVVDSDGDGLVDAAEDRNLDRVVDAGETDPQRADSDGDGRSDGDEVAAGTDPLDPNDPPSASPGSTATATPRSTATATATPQPTATSQPTATTTVTTTATATKTAMPTTTPQPSTTATATKTAMPAATDTVSATPRPTMTVTATLWPTATATAIPSATITAKPTATPTATVVPTVVPTPAIASCGNARRDAGEQCDAEDASSCAAGCRADCRCAATYHFPLDGWTTGKSSGTWAVLTDPDLGSPVLVTTTSKSTRFSLEYPERAELDVRYTRATLVYRPTLGASVAFMIRASNGRNYQLRYRAGQGYPQVSPHAATFPVDAAGTGFQTVTRDLAADLERAFGVHFVAVRKAEIVGTVRIADLMLSEPVGDSAPEMSLPVADWTAGVGATSAERELDPELSAPTIGGPNAAFPIRFLATAAFGTLSLVVRDDHDLVVEVHLRTSQGMVRIQYANTAIGAIAAGRQATLPLSREPVSGTSFDLVTLDLAGDVARVFPGRVLSRVAGVRLHGQFHAGEIVLQHLLEGR